jgi:DNA modification methylase
LIINRDLLAHDINPEALEITKKALDFEYKSKSKIKLELNDARDLKSIKNNSIDFVLTHPPYADIIKYSE